MSKSKWLRKAATVLGGAFVVTMGLMGIVDPALGSRVGGVTVLATGLTMFFIGLISRFKPNPDWKYAAYREWKKGMLFFGVILTGIGIVMIYLLPLLLIPIP